MSDDQRIAKLLARAGIASRREVERMIAEGRVALDGKILDTPATILRNLNGVTVDDDPVEAPSAARLYLYHKPPGLLVTERDPAGRPTIYDRLPKDLPRVVPVGRLDLNTEGLLLLTTDGGLKRQLELPATGIERAYRARAYGAVTQAQLEDLIEGVEIEGVRYGSINANIERRTGANVWIEMILTEGKNREVRRVLEFLGLQVSRLIRTRYGPFVLADLPPGQIGEVTQHDVVAFQKELSRPRAAGPGARANIGVSASAPAGAGIGGRSSNPRPASPRPVPVSIPPRPSPGSRPVPSGSRPVRPGSAERPARPARAEPIRPTAAMQRGDTTAPWAKPARGPRPTATAAATQFRPEPHRGDRGEELSTSPKIKHFRAAKPPRNAKPETTRVGGVAGRDTIKRPPRVGAPGRAEGTARDPAAKRAARSAGGRPAHPDEARPFRAPRSDGPRSPRADGARPARADGPVKPSRPGKGPSGGRGHPPRGKR